jgi:Uma2 family endonuclease
LNFAANWPSIRLVSVAEASQDLQPMSAVFTPRRARIDVTRYHRMIDAGIFHPDERIELIEGELLEMAPIGIPHAYAVMAFTRLLVEAIPRDSGVVSIQGPVTLGDLSEPQPDVLVLRPPVERYRKARPRGADVLLLVEVSESTLRFDRKRKLPLYARHGVPESWILNLVDGQLETYREPWSGGYGLRRVLERGEPATPALLPGVALDWAALLG